MTFPRRYLILSDYLLSKRDVGRGGVEGYDSDIVIQLSELAPLSIGEPSEIFTMFDIMKNEIVRVLDEDGEKYEKPVLGSFSIKGDSVIVSGCTTKNLNQFIKKVKRDCKQSIIECDRSVRPTKIRYHDGRWVSLSNAGRRYAFWAIYKNYPDVVSYLQISKEMKKIREPEITTLTDRHKARVHNAVNGLQRKLTENGFPDRAIVNVPGVGYTLSL